MEQSTTGRLAGAWERIGRDDAAIAGDLARLLAVDTSFPPGDGYPAFADLMEELLEPLGFRFRRVTVPRHLWHLEGAGAEGERVNLIAERPSGRPPVSLYYHVDTVPPGAGWTKPPLELTREGERLYGRGTADMKGTIAATLAALRAAQETASSCTSIPCCSCARTRRAASTRASATSPKRG